MDKERVKQCALAYIEKGWRVLPLCYPIDGKCTCGRQAAYEAGTYKKGHCSAGKAPHFSLGFNGSKDATCDKATVLSWFDKGIDFNIGVCAGIESKLVILDVDPGHGGTVKDRNIPLTPAVTTGSGGEHYYFSHPGGEIRNSAGTVAPGLDVRGNGGYVVAPPSMHPCGEEYRWKIDPKAPLADMPGWLTIKQGKAAPQTSPDEPIAEGGRNNLLTSIAGTMRNRGLSHNAILAALRVENNARCKPPLGDEELMLISGSVANYKPKNEPDLKAIILKDDLPSTVAKKFRELSPVSHHYNSIDGWSIYHNNMYQQVKDREEIKIYIRKFIAKCIVKSTKKGKDFEPLKQTGGFVMDVMGALSAKDEVHILPSQKAICSFSGALNPNTTIALRNGLLSLEDMNKPKMHAFTPDFYTFNYLPVIYDPTKLAPLWKEKCLSFYFTEEDVNVPDLIAQDIIHSWIKRFLLRIMDPHKIMALIGDKRSGKSTIGRIICALLGQANVSALTVASLAGAHGLYGLMNKQLGIMWDASVTGRQGDVTKAVETLKNISGQDNITVNPKNRDTIDLEALKLNILMLANEPADLRDSTGALASRFTFMQTTQSFIGHENPTYERDIIANELSGILNLILAAPNTIIEHPKSEALARDYAEMTSPYTAFANDCCKTGDQDSFIPVDILWAYYKDWCEQYNHRAPSSHVFKVKFFSAVSGLKRYRPRINNEEKRAIIYEHNLDQRPGEMLNIPERPQCYQGIDLLEDLKGSWSRQEEAPYRNDWS